jgi:hypothetical protein
MPEAGYWGCSAQKMKIFKVILSMLGLVAILGETLVATSAIKKRTIFIMSKDLETQVSVSWRGW